MKLGICILVVTVAGQGQIASAGLLDFESITTPSGLVLTSVDDGYGELNWTNFYMANSIIWQQAYGLNGYTYGAVSGNQVAFNGWGETAIVSSATPFIFDSAYFAAAWNDGLTVNVTGSLNGQQVDQTSFIVSSTSSTLETFNWHVDTLQISSHGGKSAGYDGGLVDDSGVNFAMDNMVIEALAAPEPSTGALLLFAPAALLLYRCRRRRVPAA